MNLLVCGNGLDHKVRPVPDVRIGAEENRPNTDGDDVFVQREISEQKREFDLLEADRFAGERRGIIFLQGRERVARGSADNGKIGAAILDQMAHLLNGLFIDEDAKDCLQKAQVGGRVVEDAGKEAASPIKKAPASASPFFRR